MKPLHHPSYPSIPYREGIALHQRDWFEGLLNRIRFDKSLAIDGGANIGLWSEVMSKRFNEVLSFEPLPYLSDEIKARSLSNVRVFSKALYCVETKVRTCSPAKRSASTATFTRPDVNGSVEAVTIDSLRLTSCGLIKLDIEGSEYFALQGAALTIKAFSPVLVVEINGCEVQRGVKKGQTDKLIKLFGYKCVEQYYDDRVYVK